MQEKVLNLIKQQIEDQPDVAGKEKIARYIAGALAGTLRQHVSAGNVSLLEAMLENAPLSTPQAARLNSLTEQMMEAVEQVLISKTHMTPEHARQRAADTASALISGLARAKSEIPGLTLPKLVDALEGCSSAEGNMVNKIPGSEGGSRK